MFIFCVEKQCIIVNQVYLQIINDIIRKLNSNIIFLINISDNFISKEEYISNAREEVKNFCSEFKKEIDANQFVKNTITPIACYLIRRYFIPTDFFEDPEFFIFDKTNISSDIFYKKKFIDLINSKSQDLQKYYDIRNNIQNIKNRKYEFHKEDFIYLRKIYNNNTSIYYIVMHKESLYIFMIKMINVDEFTKEINHEIEFCDHYSHRCMCPFYGFLKNDKGKIIGFIYEYMSNDSLQKYVENNPERIIKIFSMITINRLLQGIKYLHKNSLIHRDLKPSNILLDHDFLPYISDFETIRHTIDENSNFEMSKDVGTFLYESPEQFSGKYVSFPTDIYSFGKIIYFLFEKISMEGGILTSTDASKIIQNLFKSCIISDPKSRIDIKGAVDIFKKELDSIDALDYFFFFKSNFLEQFIYEIFILHKQYIDKIVNHDFIFNYLMYSKIKIDDYFILKHTMYEMGIFYEQNYNKARDYCELAAELNNSYAFLGLGDIYLTGRGVEKDFKKAKEYYELSAQQNNSNGICA